MKYENLLDLNYDKNEEEEYQVNYILKPDLAIERRLYESKYGCHGRRSISKKTVTIDILLKDVLADLNNYLLDDNMDRDWDSNMKQCCINTTNHVFKILSSQGYCFNISDSQLYDIFKFSPIIVKNDNATLKMRIKEKYDERRYKLNKYFNI
ncbi:hypothetical protein ACXR6G_11545 [Ancylomarina sp. YFZ004]